MMIRPATHRLCLVLLCVAIATAHTRADWLHPHLDGTNNAVQPISAQLMNLDGPPIWTVPGLNLAAGSPISLMPPFLFHPAHDSDADRVTLLALNVETGGVFWESTPLDVDNTVAFGSLSAAAADPADRSVYFASGNTVYKFDAADGTILWETELTAANTTPGLGSYEVINGSPILGAGKVFLETFGGFTISNKQVVALNQNDGSVAWKQNDQGRGGANVAFANIGGNDLVFSAGDLALNCYQAADGAPVWNSATAGIPWLAAADIWGSPTYADGRLYVVSTDFSEATSLICADALTGDLEWEVAAPSSEIPPVVMNGNVYVYGAGVEGRLAAYDAQTGAEVFNESIVTGFVFRDYMAATLDAIYLAEGGDLLIVDPSDGSVIDRRTDEYDGAVALDGRGGLYAHNGDALEAFGMLIPVELSEFVVE